MPKGDPKPANSDQIEQVLTSGGQVRLTVVGAALLLATILAAGRAKAATDLFARQPALRPLRLAFSVYDRIRTGELPAWTCALCERQRRGLQQLSVLAVIDHLDDHADKPALTGLVCVACDSVSEAQTVRRLHEVFGLGTHERPVG